MMTPIKEKFTLFVGHYGSGNFGDDIMLFELISAARAESKRIKVIFFDKYIDGFGLGANETVFINRKNKLGFLYTYLSLLPKCSEIVWGGGTCFTDEEGDGFFIGMMLARLFRLNIIYRSVGIGKLKRFSRVIKAKILLSLAMSVSFREQKSIEIANKLCPKRNFNVERDLGEVYLEGISERGRGGQDEYMLLAWRDLVNYGIGNDVLERVVGYIINESKLLNLKKIVVMNTDNCVDRTVGEVLFLKLSSVENLKIELCDELGFKEKIDLIVGAKKIVTSRLHVLIAGLVFGKLTDVYSYSPKIDSVLDRSGSSVKKINDLF